VYSDLDTQAAYMRVYLQFPNKGTEYFPAEERAKQGTSGYCSEIEVVKASYKKQLTIMPGLLAIKEDI
jgi:hypothetical protein